MSLSPTQYHTHPNKLDHYVPAGDKIHINPHNTGKTFTNFDVYLADSGNFTPAVLKFFFWKSFLTNYKKNVDYYGWVFVSLVFYPIMEAPLIITS